jgi:ribonuclease P protein component
MKKEHSLTRSQDFDLLINKGKTLKSNGLILNYDKAQTFKIGIAVPKKLGNAVFRNKNKRIIKNIIAEIKPYDIKLHIVLIVRKSFIDKTYIQKHKELEKVFKQLENV